MIDYNEYEKEGLKGPIKQLKEEHFLAFENDGLTYIGKPLEDHHEYNNRIILFDEQHKVRETEVYFSDSIRKDIFDFEGYVTERFTYDPQNRNSFKSKNIINYSTDKLTEESVGYNDKNEQTFKYVSTFDEQKRILERISYNDKNEIEDKIVWEYVENSKDYSKVYRYNGDGSLKFYTEYKRNKLGHYYEIIEYDNNAEVKEIKDLRYLYNDDGTFKNDSKKDKLALQHRAVIEEDKYGNWVKKLIYYKQKPLYIYLRSYTYFNEVTSIEDLDPTKKEFNTPLTLKNPKTTIADYWDAYHNLDKISVNTTEEFDLNSEQLKMVVDKSPSADKFSFFAYYAATTNLFPSQIEYNHENIEVLALLDDLKSMYDINIVHTTSSFNGGWERNLESYTIKFNEYPAYLLHVSDITLCNDEEYEFSPYLTNYESYEDGYLNLGKVVLLHPPDGSGLRDEDFEESLFSSINECVVEDKPEQPYIHIVEVTNNNFQLTRHTINNDFEISNLDVNYGYGFSGFHNDLMQRFKNETKGLVLFHGIPGTGKTYYIRHLLREMAIAKKIVIYMPPNMVDYLTDPSFISFLARTVKKYNSNNQFCVLLIEDAEPLLAQRQSESRIQGVTNLLNMTDGLLNDMLKLQMICTFNVELSKLDAALLRPGRLIARKEFKPLTVLDANRLAQKLGIKMEIKKPTTLSQIYAMLEGKSTIIHNPNEND